MGTVAVRSIILVVASVSWAKLIGSSLISRGHLCYLRLPFFVLSGLFTFLSLPSWQRMVHAQ
ncbi:hypothetical protein BX666DRAFT_1962133 [Dichotomocladium elegans]|nr:hypothetical protein BX666DRAFT_1962133 [Dichotomocladium elegans]